MGNAANGKVYAKYSTFYYVSGSEEYRKGIISLTSGYTKFEDIRKILAVKNGVSIDDIDIDIAVKVD
jgi:hypothetical protein